MAKAKDLVAKVSFGGVIDPSLGKALASVKSSVGSAMGKAGVAGLIGAAAAAATKLASDYQSAYRKIRIGTGATGKAVSGLMGDMEAVLAKSASSMGDVAQAISDYNTSFGATGKDLQDISSAALDVSRIFGEDLSGVVASSSKALKAWGRTAKDGAQSLNFMRKVSQATGVSVTTLQERTAQYQPTLKALGYSLESSAVLIGNLEKSGVKGERAISALNKISAMGADEWAGYYEAIKSASSETEAINIASEAFGREGAAAMASAVRNGAFAVGEMTASLKTDKESLKQLSDETMTFDDTITRLSNALKQMLLPAIKWVTKELESALRWWQSDNGKAVMEFVGDAFSWLTSFDEETSGKIERKWSKRIDDALPKFANGGWTSGPSIAGEAGTEAVISLNPATRAANLQTWREAGLALGVGGGAGGLSADFSGMVFAPTISANGSTSGDILTALRGQERAFADLIVDSLAARQGRLA